jgi:hypothetical protein
MVESLIPGPLPWSKERKAGLTADGALSVPCQSKAMAFIHFYQEVLGTWDANCEFISTDADIRFMPSVTISMLILYVICFLCNFNGVKSSGVVI